MAVETVVVPANLGSVEHVPGSKGFRLQGENTNAAGNNKVYGQDGTGAKGFFAGSLIKGMLEALTEANRLDASAIQNLPSGGSPTKTTLTAGNTTMVIWHFGAAPTLASSAAGVFTLTIPATCVPTGFDWSGNNTSTDGSGDMQLTIVSADTHNLFYVPAIINKANNQLANLASLGIVIAQSNGTAGTIVATTTSMGGFGSSGFVYMGRFAA